MPYAKSAKAKSKLRMYSRSSYSGPRFFLRRNIQSLLKQLNSAWAYIQTEHWPRCSDMLTCRFSNELSWRCSFYIIITLWLPNIKLMSDKMNIFNSHCVPRREKQCLCECAKCAWRDWTAHVQSALGMRNSPCPLFVICSVSGLCVFRLDCACAVSICPKKVL